MRIFYWLFRTEKKVYDSSVFNDPIADETSWRPLNGGGTNVTTRRLYFTGKNKANFGPSYWALFFYGLFVYFGIDMAVGGVWDIIWGDNGLAFADVEPEKVFFGSLLIMAGFIMFLIGSTPIVFDKDQACLWKGSFWNRKGKAKDGTRVDYRPLTEVHAIQLISEFVYGYKKSFTSYELNLVLKDASRINIVDQAGQFRVETDAAKLGEFLGVPVWNAI